MATVGILYPGHSAEDDFAVVEARLPTVRLPVAITSVGEDAHRVDALLDLGRTERLAEGAARLGHGTSGLDDVGLHVRQFRLRP